MISKVSALPIPSSFRNAAAADLQSSAGAEVKVASLASIAGSAPATSGDTVAVSVLLAAQEAQAKNVDAHGLTKEEAELVAKLKAEDAKVRRHERAHAAAAGPYAGRPNFEFVQGPDGKFYAVSGEVKIDASPAGSPAATIRKMEIIIRAAMAPVDPSPQDKTVAAQAKQMLARAQAEQAEEKMSEQTGQTGSIYKNQGLNLAGIMEAYMRASEAIAKPEAGRQSYSKPQPLVA